LAVYCIVIGFTSTYQNFRDWLCWLLFLGRYTWY